MANLLFADNVRHMRELNGLKQADMLAHLGYKQSTWNGYERAASSPNLDDLIRISDFFGILESDLLRTQIAAADLPSLYNSYILKSENPGKLDLSQRAIAFISYYSAMDWALQHALHTPAVKNTTPLLTPVEKKGRGFRYTNDDPGAHSADTAARIARLESVILSMKQVLHDF